MDFDMTKCLFNSVKAEHALDSFVSTTLWLSRFMEIMDHYPTFRAMRATRSHRRAAFRAVEPREVLRNVGSPSLMGLQL
eukprot:5499640-Prorocentrum_lima.AAC.1